MSLFEERLREDVFRAYFDARRNKRNTLSQLQFEVNAESELLQLCRELLDRSYVPQPAICFITRKPVLREVFASQFRDRVVHHLLFNYIAPVFERSFIYDSYSCRKGKGTLFGIRRLEHHIRSCTDNYTRPAFVLKLDIRGYFMSIDKQILYGLITERMQKWWKKTGIDKEVPERNPELIDFLVRSILFRDPTENCIIHGSLEEWKDLPPSKSLLKRPKGIGLPIGDLTSQLFSNIYLSVLDDYVKRTLGVKHYGRYVDDFFVVHPSRAFLKELVPQIRTFLKERLGLQLHPDKVYLQDCTHGVAFLGAFVKPHRRYAVHRTVKQFRATVREVECFCYSPRLSQRMVMQILPRLNSYGGILSWFRTGKILGRSLSSPALWKHFYFKPGFRCAVPVDGYRQRRYVRYEEKSAMQRLLDI